MAELKVENFKYGLDARRDDLVSQPGTLVTLQNGHVNPGGEVETRGQFTRDANLFPTDTFGLQDTDSGLMTFGSDSVPNAALPSGITYQRLPFPIPAFANVIPMTGVVFSCAFKGKPFVLVSYSGYSIVFAFYNGVLVAQITDGVVQTAGGVELLSNLSIQLATIVNRISGWLADPNVIGVAYDGVHDLGYQESALLGSTMVMSPPNVHFTPTLGDNNSVSGVLGFRLIDQNYPGRPAIAANAAFAITAGANGTIDVQAEFPTSGSPTATIVNGAITFAASNPAAIAQGVAQAINNFTFLTGYSAAVLNTTVTVYAPAGYGAFTGLLQVITTGDITTAGGVPFAQVTLTITQGPPTIINSGQGLWAVSVLVSAQVSGLSAGGMATFTWSQVNSKDQDIASPANFFDISATTGVSIRVIAAFDSLHSALSANFRCTVTDTGNNTKATVFFNVSLTHP